MGLSALANGSETARIQSFDLHKETTMGTANATRLQRATEFNSTLLNSNSDNHPSIAVPPDLCHGTIINGSSSGKGETLFNDLENRRHIPLPQTGRYLEKYRPAKASYFMVWKRAGSSGAYWITPRFRMLADDVLNPKSL